MIDLDIKFLVALPTLRLALEETNGRYY